MEVIYYTESDFAGGGNGDVAYYAVRGLYKKGYIKSIICRDYKETEIDSSLIKRFFPLGRTLPRIFYGIQRFIYPGFNAGRFNRFLYERISLAFGYIDSCDIFHFWAYPYKLMIKAKEIGAITIMESGFQHPNYANKILTEEYKKYGLKLPLPNMDKLLKTIDESDYIFVNSKFARNTYLENGVNEDKLIQSFRGVDLDKFYPVSNNLRNKDDKFRCIFVGDMKLRKGVQYLLKAWKELNLKNSELIICGHVLWDAKRVVDKYRNMEDIKFLGRVDPVKYYQMSDVFVYPSLVEGSAKVNHEAMACGLPVITTPNAGSVVRDGKDGFLIPIRNVDALKEKIQYFYDNPTEIKRMGKNARKNIENYSWDKYSEWIVKTYENLII